ncbi:MAG: hypothetical protein Q8O94_01155 [bacterium]|nr:hypothetical protein [bacterium]
METKEVTCPRCRAHGIFAHGQAREIGITPKTSRRYFEEYERITSPSQEEFERLSHYRRCHTIKFLSMIQMYLDWGVSSYWLERTPDEWRLVASLYMSGASKEALDRVRALNRSKPPAPPADDTHFTTTSIEEVNEHRRNSSRIREFNSNRLIPSQSEFYTLLNRDHNITNLDEAIERLSTPETGESRLGLGGRGEVF